MAEIIRMPKMSDTMTEGVVAKWHKKIGDTIKSGELVAEIETDKATMEFESYQNGTLLYIGVPEGKGAPVDAILAIIGKPGEDYSALLKEEKSETKKAEEKKPEPVKPQSRKISIPETPKPAPVAAAASVVTEENGRIKASPLAKRLAAEKGIDLSRLSGTGDAGRVVKRDIEWVKPGMMPSYRIASAEEKESFEEAPVSQMRKTIARRLSESKFTAPHFYLTMEIQMDRCMDARESINLVSPVKISFNDIIIKAAAAALKQHPKVNSSWLGDTIRINHHVHIGVAVAVDEGLLVPVIRHANHRTLSEISQQVKEFAQKAKNKKLQPQDWEGNTFTISNLGMFGIEEFTAIINPPDACILAVGGIKQTPVVVNGKLRIGNVMKVTLSCDHRVVDGVTGSQFLQTFKGLLENPVVLLGRDSI
ncbi:MAG: pyruvate dehydrogenase complex dihydrolipoamide acetyltransferase [Bacteroidia bacterium]|nr:pyruvate dehydrogenase complex dihydrolipoamide acetyltransferase [Bacteroidia bacterium]